jgi:hypothetical protein
MELYGIGLAQIFRNVEIIQVFTETLLRDT